MSDFLATRGRSVETVFGFLGDGHFALVLAPLFREDVRLPFDEAGVARCRLGGLPAALVQVDDALCLDVAALAATWPRLFSELVTRIGEAEARALVARAAVVRPIRSGDELKELILEHQVHAKHLHALGEQPSGLRALAGEARFTLRFPRGALELTYERTAFDPDASSDSARAVAVRWRDALVALPPTGEVAWREEELAEVVVLASMQIGAHPRAVLDLLQRVFPEGADALQADDAMLATILNLWGVALRNTDEPQAAIRVLRRALPIAERADPKLEQQVTYNLGYALLASTMKQRRRVGARDGIDEYSAHYDLAEEHRSTWTECSTLFERAAALDPSDVTARAQVDQSRQLLALLDRNAGAATPEARTRTTRPTQRSTGPASKAKGAPSTGPADWLPLVLVVGVVVFLAYALTHGRTPARPASVPTAPVAHVPSARELSDDARAALLDRFDLAALPLATDAPCPITVSPPAEVPRGVVVAPHLARAIGTGELYGTEYFDGTLRQYAAHFAPELEVRPLAREGIGPLTGAPGPAAFRLASHAYALTLLVTGWLDPIVEVEGESLVPGQVNARLLVWSYDTSRFACSADVTAENSTHLTITGSTDLIGDGDDTLNRARVDLIEQALRVGIPMLVATSPDHAAPEAATSDAGVDAATE